MENELQEFSKDRTPQNTKGGFLPGSQFWAIRQRDAANIVYLPDEVLQLFIEYYEWNRNNPLYDKILHQKSGNVVDVPKIRAMSITAFCLYAGISKNTFSYYKKREKYKEVMSIIEDAIYTQKFEYAAAGLLNTTIMARDLGLGDTINHTLQDRRKEINELFPQVEDIDAIEVTGTSLEEVNKLNEEANDTNSKKGTDSENQ